MQIVATSEIITTTTTTSEDDFYSKALPNPDKIESVLDTEITD